jgi:predicted protein tyrosine phosphatase
MITVSSYWELERWMRARPSRWLVSILGPKDNLPWPKFFPPDRHLKLAFDDTQRTVGGAGPSIEQIGEMIAFFRRWNCDGSMMLHCHGGISRSPAAALIAMVIFNAGHERLATTILRNQARHADPNPAMIELADRALQLGGSLLAATKGMSPATAKGGRRFIELPADLTDDLGRKGVK